MAGAPLKKRVALLLVSVCLLCLGTTGIGSYLIGNSQGYTSGHANGYTSGYAQGHTNGYSQGETDGYSKGSTDGYQSGYNAEQFNFQQWLNQSCFTYPFLLLDISQYMACHR
jgi:hypothetical protein